MNKVLIRKKFDKLKFLLHITKFLFENVTICILLPEFAGIVFRVSFNFDLGHISNSLCLSIDIRLQWKADFGAIERVSQFLAIVCIIVKKYLIQVYMALIFRLGFHLDFSSL